MNVETKQQELADIEFNFIELPKFKKSEDELTTLLDKWVYFIKHASNLQIIPENTDTIGLQAAYAVAERFRWSRDDLEVYDYWSMKLQDERGAIAVAEQRGEQRGRQAEKFAAARTMMADGMDSAMIMKYTGLSQEEVTQLMTGQE